MFTIENLNNFFLKIRPELKILSLQFCEFSLIKSLKNFFDSPCIYINIYCVCVLTMAVQTPGPNRLNFY